MEPTTSSTILIAKFIGKVIAARTVNESINFTIKKVGLKHTPISNKIDEIDENVKLIIEAPLKKAKLLLIDGINSNSIKLIEKSKDSFYEALSLTKNNDLYLNAVINFFISICWFFESNEELFKEKLDKSLTHCYAYFIKKHDIISVAYKGQLTGFDIFPISSSEKKRTIELLVLSREMEKILNIESYGWLDNLHFGKAARSFIEDMIYDL